MIVDPLDPTLALDEQGDLNVRGTIYIGKIADPNAPTLNEIRASTPLGYTWTKTPFTQERSQE